MLQGMRDLRHLDLVYPAEMLCSQSYTPSFSLADLAACPVVPQFPCSYIAVRRQSRGPWGQEQRRETSAPQD